MTPTTANRQPPAGGRAFVELWIAGALVVVCTAAMLQALQGADSSLAHVALGLFAAGFAPGFGLLLALFPRQLGLAERLALSVPCSLIVGVLLGVLLDIWPRGLAPAPMIISGWVVTIGVLALGGFRVRTRGLSASGTSVVANGRVPSEPRAAGIWIAFPRQVSVLITFAGIGLVAVTGVWALTSFGAALPTVPKPFTALSVAGASHEVTPGEPMAVTIDNREGQPMLYDIEVRAGGRLLQRLDAVAVDNGAQYTFDIPPLLVFGPPIDVIAYRTGDAQPYRQLSMPLRGYPS